MCIHQNSELEKYDVELAPYQSRAQKHYDLHSNAHTQMYIVSDESSIFPSSSQVLVNKTSLIYSTSVN